MICSRGYCVKLWVKMIMVQVENTVYGLVSETGLYDLYFWNFSFYHGTSYIINSVLQLHRKKWNSGFIHFQPLLAASESNNL